MAMDPEIQNWLLELHAQLDMAFDEEADEIVREVVFVFVRSDGPEDEILTISDVRMEDGKIKVELVR